MTNRLTNLALLLFISTACVGQTTYFAGGYIGYTGGLGFRNPAYIAILGAEKKTEHWYGHLEATADSSNKIGNPATDLRGMGEIARRFGANWYLGVGASGGYLYTRDYSKYRENPRLAFGRLGEHFDSHAAYIFPFGNTERVQGGEYELVWHVKKHLALMQKYQLLMCKTCIDSAFREHYLAGSIQYGARFEWGKR